MPATGPSRGLVLKLDQQTQTATLLREYTGGNEFESEYMGDTQPLQNGNTLIGWGSEPYFTEYGPTGKRLLEARFPGNDLSYRTMREPWVGDPLTYPAGAARESGGRTTVYASWNGATELASWRVLAGSSGAGSSAGSGSSSGASSGGMTAVASAAKSGFETAISVPSGYQSYEVQALDAAGRVIGASRPFTR